MSTVPVADSLLLPDLLVEQTEPDMAMELRLMRRGKRLVAGIDEAGRGPLAGPVVAAAVILDPDRIPEGLNDSKLLPAKMREELMAALLATAEIAWCAVDPRRIDRLNILQATLAAMTHAVTGLPRAPQAALIDGRDVPPGLSAIGRAVIKGDRISQSIAAASIVAKTVRDRIMQRAECDFPGYDFSANKGYGTPAHLRALRRIGPCPLHRRSFAPVAEWFASD